MRKLKMAGADGLADEIDAGGETLKRVGQRAVVNGRAVEGME